MFNQESEDTLQNQIFSINMTENLINDLLDLAKFENNTFELSQDYFSLSHTVCHTFKMIQHLASQ